MNLVNKIFASIGVGFIAQLIQEALQTIYLTKFLEGNLINILVALLAVNSATMGIVLTKMRDLLDSKGMNEGFVNTKNQMLLSIKEQVTLIALSIIFLTLASSPLINQFAHVLLFLNCATVGIFVFSIFILYDTAKSVLIIIDYK